MTRSDLASPRHCLCFNLRRAARLATRRYDDALASTGLTTPQFSALALLAETGPLPTGAFAAAMETERTTATRNLTILEDEGLVTRKSSPEDARRRVIALTAKGRRRFEAALKAWRSAQETLVSTLGAANARAMLDAAATVEKALANRS